MTAATRQQKVAVVTCDRIRNLHLSMAPGAGDSTERHAPHCILRRGGTDVSRRTKSSHLGESHLQRRYGIERRRQKAYHRRMEKRITIYGKDS
jgi:hypothetical protein